MDWHRFFGLALKDFFSGSPYAVEIELDLSAKKQLLDVLVLRKFAGEFDGRLPDGFDNLASHNLFTFKSFQQALDAWAMKELAGHSVNYRKQASPSLNQLLPEDESCQRRNSKNSPYDSDRTLKTSRSNGVIGARLLSH